MDVHLSIIWISNQGRVTFELYLYQPYFGINSIVYSWVYFNNHLDIQQTAILPKRVSYLLVCKRKYIPVLI